MFHQCYTWTDVYRMLQVMTGDNDGGTRLLVVLCEQVFHGTLAAGVEEVERLVQNQKLWLQKHSCHDAYLLLVACREIPDEFLLTEEFTSKKCLEGGQFVFAVLL